MLHPLSSPVWLETPSLLLVVATAGGPLLQPPPITANLSVPPCPACAILPPLNSLRCFACCPPLRQPSPLIADLGMPLSCLRCSAPFKHPGAPRDAAPVAYRRASLPPHSSPCMPPLCLLSILPPLNSPVRPETPRLLPSVASVWPPLMAALRDSRNPVVLRAVPLVSELVRLGGGTFLAARLRQQAMPLLLQLLRRGTAALTGSGGGLWGALGPGGTSGGEPLAPAAVQAVRVTVLRCFAALGGADAADPAAAGSTPPADLTAVAAAASPSLGLQRLGWDIAAAALPYLGSSQPPPLQAAARAAMLGAARLDADAVWMVLYDAAALESGGEGIVGGGITGGGGRGGGSVAAMARQRAGVGASPSVEGVGRLPAWKAGGLSTKATGGWPVTAPLRGECGGAAVQLLAAVEGVPPAWHARAPVVAPDWGVPGGDELGA